MSSTTWHGRNSSQSMPQTNNRNSLNSMLTSGNLTLSKSPSNARASRSSSLFNFGSKKTSHNHTQITPFTPNPPNSTPQQPSQPQPSIVEQNRNSNDDLNLLSHVKRPSLVNDTPTMNPGPVIQREIKSVVDLALAHAHKIYYSGPLIRRIERLADGNKPALDEGWVDVWAQLGGTTLSVWDMKAIEEASKRGEEVPPSYINITDCFVQVLGALTSPATPTFPSKRYTNVITINTAGSNLIFFACPSSAALVAWATSIRLAGWEKSRLEEIYTGHLLRMTLSDNGTWRDPPTTLTKGRLEGFVTARITGHTDWKTFWMSLSLSTEYSSEEYSHRSNSPIMNTRSKRVSNLFSRSYHTDTQPTGPAMPVIAFYASPKPKDRKKPLLTMRNVTQAYAVYPERPEVFQKSTLIKIEGYLGTEDVAGPMKGRECWIMIMPETQQAFPVLELVKWLIAIHDIYKLYGRPNGYVWDPRQSVSMWFGYPVGPQREHLFVSREEAERLDPRDDRTSSIRTQLTQILIQRMYPTNSPTSPGQPSEVDFSQKQSPQQNVNVVQVTPSTSPVVDVEFGPTLAQYRQSSETQSIPTSHSAEIPQQSHSQASKQVPSSPAHDTLTPSGTRTPVLQSTEVMSTSSRHAAVNPTFATHPTPPQTNGDGSLPGNNIPIPQSVDHRQNQTVTASSTTTGREPEQLPRFTSPVSPLQEGSAESFKPSSSVTAPLSLHQHPTIFPLHPRAKSPQALSPPRSPPLPPTPKQASAPVEIKQPVPLNTNLTNASLGIAANINDLVNEPAALFVLQQTAATVQQDSHNVQRPVEDWADTDENEEITGENDSDFSGPESNPPPRRLTPVQSPPSAYKPGNTDNSAKADGNTRVRISVGRKPSGARVRPGSGLVRLPDPGTQSSTVNFDQMDDHSELPYDDTVNALAAFNFLESQGIDASTPIDPPSSKPNVSMAESARMPMQRSISPAPSNEVSQFRSSFALSKQAVERQAKVQAQQEARHQPGKPKVNGGTRSGKKVSGTTWVESSEEDEDEDEDEEDEEEGSDTGPSTKPSLPNKDKHAVPELRTSVYPSAQPNTSREAITYSRGLPRTPSNGGLDPNRGTGEDRRRTPSVDEHRNHNLNPHLFARQSVWSSVLDPTPPPPKPSGSTRNTFIQVDESETMTKAFQPQGLLSAGLQDKEDRSARRQEELARESGASLINVPSKPPPPQTGLLGAITAHERERKREGGVGAALTERERERRLAEERQRKLDELQRQQLDQISQGGLMNPYEMLGQQNFSGFMPGFDPRMSMNPMMLNPYMGFPMMPYGNPQQVLAAQMAAQQAYHQAMATFSQAGSQAGDIPPNPNAGMTTPLVPQMTGMSGIQSGMMGMDPRMLMAMNMNPWMMNPAVMGGMNPNNTPGMGANTPGSGMAHMGLNSMGGSDPRMSSFPNYPRQDSAGGGLGGLGRPSSFNTPSPRQGSPAPPAPPRSSNDSPFPPAQS